MVAPRSALVLIGIGLLACVPARAAETPQPAAAIEILPPDLPEATVTLDAPREAAPPADAAAVDIPPPDLPAVTVAVPPAAAPAAQTATGLDIPPPALPDAPVTLTVADRLAGAIAARLADGKAEWLPRLSHKQRDAVAAFYALGAFKPVWIADGAWTPAAQAVIARLKSAEDEGLDPTAYPIPAIGVVRRGDTAADLAEAELSLSAAAVLYARDARGGRIDLARLSNLITPTLDLPDADAVLTDLASAPDAGAALEAYNPRQEGYVALKRKLAELRASRPSGTPMVRVPPGRTLKVGMRDSRVPLIRARFGLGPAESEDTYDERVAEAVAGFQREQGLKPNGILTRQTVAALSGGPSPARIEADIVANMERWRWLPADLGERYIKVDIPAFRLEVVDGGRIVHQARVIVGKPDTPTPIFSGTMEYAVVNPSWNIPPSILKKEFLPHMAEDPFYAEKRGYQVIRRNGHISIRQPPGERNALGFIKFMFPNRHAVYLHDTPNRSLFRAERRAFSHGCVRVDQPFALADILLGQAWPEKRLKALIGKGERTIPMHAHLPVHLTYFTTSVDADGRLHTLDDLYGFNRKVKAALGLDG